MHTTGICWAFVALLLARNRRVIIPDLTDFDFGLSQSPALRAGTGVATQEDHVQMCVDLADALSLEQLDLCGHSYGGAVALKVARRQPPLVRKLILLAPFAIGLNQLMNPAEAQWDQLNGVLRAVLTQFVLPLVAAPQDLHIFSAIDRLEMVSTPNLATMAMARTPNSEEGAAVEAKAVSPSAVESSSTTTPSPAPSPAPNLTPSPAPNLTPSPALHRTLIIWGDQDSICCPLGGFGDEGGAQLMRPFGGTAEGHWIVGAEHWLTVDSAVTVARLIDGFGGELGAEGGAAAGGGAEEETMRGAGQPWLHRSLGMLLWFTDKRSKRIAQDLPSPPTQKGL
jgi:pimeloyl-ACP methyl ester carboxylesterase